MTTTCDEIVALLPWFLNRTLPEDERRVLGDHLATCPSCRAELAATAEVGRLHGVHPPVAALVALAFGDAGGGNRRTLEAHVASCDACRQELAMARASADLEAGLEEAEDDVLPFDPGGARRASRPWRVAGLVAAALVVGLGFGSLLGPGSDVAPERAPETEPIAAAGHRVVELLPEDLVVRGDGTAAPILPSLETEAWITLLLVAPGADPDGSYRIEVRNGGGKVLWRSGAVAPDELGSFPLLLSGEVLGDEARTIALLPAATGRDEEPLAIYPLR